MAYYFPLAQLMVNGLGVLDQAEARLRGLVYGVQPLPSPSPAAQSSGETKPPKLPQKLEVSLSTCTVRVWTHPHILGSLGPGDSGDQRARRGHELSRWAGRPDFQRWFSSQEPDTRQVFLSDALQRLALVLGKGLGLVTSALCP